MKHKKALCSVWRRCRDWSNVSKVVWEVSWSYWHFVQIILCCGPVLCIGRCLAAPLASPHWKPIVGDCRHIQNIHINNCIGENEKKRIFYFMGKTKQTLWPTQYLPKVPLLNTIAMEVRISTYGIWEDKNIQSITASYKSL